MALKRINKELTDLGRYVLFNTLSCAAQGLGGVAAGGVPDRRIKPNINMIRQFLADSIFLANSDPPSSCSAGPIGDDLVRSYRRQPLGRSLTGAPMLTRHRPEESSSF